MRGKLRRDLGKQHVEHAAFPQQHHGIPSPLHRAEAGRFLRARAAPGFFDPFAVAEQGAIGGVF